MKPTAGRLVTVAAVTGLLLPVGLMPGAPAQARDDHEGPVANISSVPRGIETPNPDDPLQVLIELSEPLAAEWSVLVSTFDGTAAAPADYRPVAERVTVPAGERSVAIPIELVADRLVEPPEWFAVEISEPSSGQIGIGRVEITILDGAPPGA